MKIKIAILSLFTIILIGFFVHHKRGQSKPASVGESKSVTAKIEFIIDGPLEIAHDYNQIRLIRIRNRGPGMATLRLRAISKTDELLVGFVGRGTSEWHEENTTVGIPSGETWQLPLLLHADRSAQKEYKIVLEASQPDGSITTAEVLVKVKQPKLQLTTHWEPASSAIDKARLSRWLIINNDGETAVSDLSLHFHMGKEVADQKLRWNRMIEKYQLAENGSLKVKITPRLFPTFQSIKGELVLTGLNQEFKIPYAVKLPKGKQVFVTLSRTTRSSSSEGTRCTNRPKVDYSLPATDGTGGEWTPSRWSDEDGLVKSDDSPKDADSTPEETKDEEEEDDDGGFTWLPESATDEDDEDDEEENDSSMTAEEKAEKEKKKEARKIAKEKKESEDDDASFDLADDNIEDLTEGLMPPNTNGTEPDIGGRRIDDNQWDKDLVEVQDMKKLISEPISSKEIFSHIDKKGKKTHMSRRTRKDGTEFLNFGMGIQKGKRKKVPMRINGRIGQPVLGPRPGPDGGAMAAYTSKTNKDKEKGQVIEIVDPVTGKKIQLGAGQSDSPALVRNGTNVDAYFRENGELQRKTIDESFSIKPHTNWPSSPLKVGPILSAKSSPDGTPNIITRDNSGITIHHPKGKDTYKATAADIGFDPSGARITALRRADGSIEAVTPDGTVTALVPAALGNSAPTIVKTKDGNLRMLFSRTLPADSNTPETGLSAGGSFSMDYKDGRWSAPRRQLIAHAPVEEAALITNFKLPYGHAHYKPMNTKVLVNGKQVGEMKGKTPAGRYIFPVSPEDLQFANREGGDKNKITILAKGMGSGNFHLSDRVGLYTRHKLCQDCLVAKSPEEAEKLAHLSDSSVRHIAPDLIVASNGYELPRSANPGEELDVTLSLFNAGDRPAKSGTLTAHINGRVVGKREYKSIPPFRGKKLEVKIKLPLNWVKGSTLRMNIKTPSAGDADPSNNDLDFYILKAPSERITERSTPVRIDPSNIDPARLSSITPGTSAKPHQELLKAGQHWYRLKPNSGKLQIELVGENAERVRGMQLFDTEGNQVRDTPVKGPFYLRVDAPDASDKKTKLNIWWES